MIALKLLLQPLIILLGFDIITVLSELPRPRGVSISLASIYEPKETFLCEDGSKTINYIQINDDFCDCADGSDEPGTSACSNGQFHCMNLGYRPLNIPSSRVNDGICDCCDASDEYNSNKQCINNCMELGREERQRERNRQELLKKGTMLRSDLINKGKQLKDERKKKLQELQNRKIESEALREDKENQKQKAEILEKEALEIYRQLQENENLEKIEKEANENRKEAIETFLKFDLNQDNFIDIAEIQNNILFDKDRDGVVSEDEAKFFLDEKDQIDQETFLALAWPRIKPYLMLDSGLFQPPSTDEIDENNNKKSDNEEETVSNQDASENTEKTEQEDDQEENLNNAKPTGQDDEDDEEEHADDDSDDTETENETENENETTQATNGQEYDPETQKLIDQANAARNEYSDADAAVREVETEIKEIEELITKDYGIEEEFAPLDGECFNYDDREYVYKLCPFDRTSQQPRSGGSETRLGTWDRWNGENDKYSRMLYSNGASCWNGPQRSAVIIVECGLENKITSVTEPNRCEYHFIFQTPAACYLIDDSLQNDFHDEL